MASSKAAWGIEIGADSIKAIRLERDGDNVSVSDFTVIPHKKVLTTPELDQDEMVRLGLGQFISQKALVGEHLVMSVPGHAAFARFAKLPPVDPKKVADIVKFEAVQQIPFPIDQVEWDYQTFTKEGLPDIEVGIFAITRDKVQSRLSLYGELGIQPDVLTLSPVAVYNAMAYDLSLGKDNQPIVFLDIGTSATDLIIADEGRCWIRTFPLGGTHFTDAVVNAFKLSYSKAEKLKQESTSSKYAKQIMQAMRPVFSDLLQDVQRSLGYYTSLHRNRELKTMIGLGSTMKIPGLRKFLGQQLQMDVLRLDEYKRIRVEGREAASFAANAVNMATAYGLALQGVGLAPIAVNLMPVNSLRQQVWHSKTKWFAAAAALVVLGAGTMFIRPLRDAAALRNNDSTKLVSDVISQGNRYKKEYQEIEAGAAIGYTAENYRRLLADRELWPQLLADSVAAVAAANPQPQLLTGTPEQVQAIDPGERRLVVVEKLDGAYEFKDGKRRFTVTMDVMFSHAEKTKFLNDTVGEWLRANAERPDVPYKIVKDSISLNPAKLSTITATGEGEKPAGSGGSGARDNSPGDAPKADEPEPEPVAPPAGGPAFGGVIGGRNRGGVADPGSEAAPGLPAVPSSEIPSTPTGGDQSAKPDQPSIKLDEVAPIPKKPPMFKAGQQFYRVPITFQVELTEQVAAPAPEVSSAAERSEVRS